MFRDLQPEGAELGSFGRHGELEGSGTGLYGVHPHKAMPAKLRSC